MENLIMIQNTRGYLDEDGTVFLSLEDVARGLGFTQRQNKKGKTYESIRWETISRYLNDLGVPQEVGEDTFIPENIFYKLCFKASNTRAKGFQNFVTDDVLPAIRKTGGYIPTNSYDSDEEVMARALLIAQNTLIAREKRILALEEKTETLEIMLNESMKFFTVAKYNKIYGMGWSLIECQKIGKLMSRYCRDRCIEIRQCETNDERFGSVNSYPLSVWEDFLEKRAI